jgi:plastocyanin
VGVEAANRGKRDLPFYIAAATLALAAAARAQANLSPTVPSGPQPAEIKIVSSEFKYSPSRVLVPARHTVTIILDNNGAETERGIFVPALGFRLEAKAGEIARKTAVFDQTGEFEFSCEIPGHREAA